MKRDGDESYNRISTLALNMQRFLQNATKNRILTEHQKTKVYNMHQFLNDLPTDDDLDDFDVEHGSGVCYN